MNPQLSAINSQYGIWNTLTGQWWTGATWSRLPRRAELFPYASVAGIEGQAKCSGVTWAVALIETH